MNWSGRDMIFLILPPSAQGGNGIAARSCGTVPLRGDLARRMPAVQQLREHFGELRPSRGFAVDRRSKMMSGLRDSMLFGGVVEQREAMLRELGGGVADP